MIIGKDVNGNITEVQCDICKISYVNQEELDEFIRFDYVMGEKSQFPNYHVQFDCCQDCMIDKFDEIFDGLEVVEELENDDNDKNYFEN